MFDLLQHLESSQGLLSFPDVRGLLGVSDRTLRKMIADKAIPSFLVGGQRRFCPGALSRWVTKKCPEMAKGRT